MLIYLAMIESPEGKAKFEAIYYKYRDLMFYVANKVLWDIGEAEDAVHESFIKIIDILDKIGEIDNPQTRALFVIITKNKAIDILRKHQKEKAIPLDVEYMGGQYHAEVERMEDGQLIAQAIARLPETYRTVILLKYAHGYSMDEIANILSISQENVKKTIQRAKKKLELLLQEESR